MRGSRFSEVKNVFDLWRENGCQVPFRATRGWSKAFWVTIVKVVPVGDYGEVYGFGNIKHEEPFQRDYWGEPGHVVKVANAGCGGWSFVPIDSKH